MRWLSVTVGLLVICTGTVSSASIVNGFLGYLQSFVDLDLAIIIVALVFGMITLAAWGIGQFVTAAALVTVIEIGGLLIIIGAGGCSLADFPNQATQFMPNFDPTVWASIFAGTFLAFYALIGFEDIVNMAEERKEPRQIVPWAFVVTLAVTVVLYVLVLVVALLAVPLEQLAGSAALINLVFAIFTGGGGKVIGIIGILAMVNGALIQLMMASRVLYGLADQARCWVGWVRSTAEPARRCTRRRLLAQPF